MTPRPEVPREVWVSVARKPPYEVGMAWTADELADVGSMDDELSTMVRYVTPAPALLTADDVARLTAALHDGSTRAVCVALDEVLYTKGDNDPTAFHGAARWLLAQHERMGGAR